MITYEECEDFPGGVTAYRMLKNMDNAMSPKEAETCHYIHMITTYLAKRYHHLNVSMGIPTIITSNGNPLEAPKIPRFIIHLHRIIENNRLDRLMRLFDYADQVG